MMTNEDLSDEDISDLSLFQVSQLQEEGGQQIIVRKVYLFHGV